MNLEKEIIVEKFKGMHNAFNSLIGSHSLYTKSTEEVKIILNSAKESYISYNKLKKDTEKIIFERDNYLYALINLEESKFDVDIQKEKLIKLFKEKFSQAQKDLFQANEEREHLKTKCYELDKNYQDLQEEFKKFRQKVKVRYISLSRNEEKFCKNCQKTYFESDNFNWSCKTHISKLTSNIYWCCGQTGKKAPGCSISKHYAKEESDFEDEPVIIPIGQKFCSSCKEIGHSSLSCAKDPNVRSNWDISEEKQRLMVLRKKRNMDLMERKTLLEFSASLDNNKDEEFQDEEFGDLRKMKSDFTVDEAFNKVKLEIEPLEEELLESRRPSRTRRGSYKKSQESQRLSIKQ
ncbi:hypothetical protein SteCoe_30001 [Stentor coeruleus]|uniref:Uncharacterized protein n=1 Tax=Stentor coeruleus TaxID=5963 RepID=A0A1R2B4W1_9CILI|nr:hypothetical protein SteCoe_30001 [Stentor coeruleus]